MRFLRTSLPLLVCFLAFGACDDDPVDVDPGPFDLTFSGDATFQGAHGGDAIEVALLEIADSTVIATRSGTVSASADPSFSFTFEDMLEEGEDIELHYDVHYWIDSNFPDGDTEGTVGVCDPPAIDHQWSTPIGQVIGDVTIEVEHDPDDTSEVCETFGSE